MKKEIFEGLKYTVINSLVKEYQETKNIEYRNELLNVINLVNNFLNYDKFLENCNSKEQINIDGKYSLRIRNVAIFSLYNAMIEDLEKDIVIVELTKFFNRCIAFNPIEKQHIKTLFIK